MTLNVTFRSKKQRYFRHVSWLCRHVDDHCSWPWCPISAIFCPMAMWASQSTQRTQIYAHRAWSPCSVAILDCLRLFEIAKKPFVGAVSACSRCPRENLRQLFGGSGVGLPLKSAFRFCVGHHKGCHLRWWTQKFPLFFRSPFFPPIASSRFKSKKEPAFQICPYFLRR